jgi:NAD(P)-dependent dehydrogenase (short-subunit alcohol dehydrogenase family)
MHDLTGQVVLITGIGCIGEGWGNGVATATLFARQGTILLGCNLPLEAAEISKFKILAKNPQTDITVMRADATSSASVKAFVDACMTRHKRIDILVNNVGRSLTGDLAPISEEIWGQQMDVNLNSVYLTLNLVLPIMERSRPLALSLTLAVTELRHVGKPQAAYSASKAAILGLARSTAVT